MLADVPQFIILAPISFLLGVCFGFLASNRWKITKRNGNEQTPKPPIL